MTKIVASKGPPSYNPTPMDSLKALLVDTTIFLLSWLFWFLDFFVSFYGRLYQTFFGSKSPTSTSEQKPTVVIVGASFAGMTALQKLSRLSNKLRLVLIDQRDYFEYTPSVLRLVCEPNYYRTIAKNLVADQEDTSSFEFHQGKVISIAQGEKGSVQKVLTYQPVSSEDNRTVAGALPTATLRYDHLILATGATYASPVWPTSDEWTLIQRGKGWQKAYKNLQQARRVVVLGAGAVGVELAAEIVEHYGRSKEIFLVDAERSITPIFPAFVGEYARAWFEQRDVNLLLGKKLASWTDTSCTFVDGTLLQADIIYNCLGSRPNSEMVQSLLKTGDVHQDGLNLTKRGDIIVDNSLKVRSGGLQSCSIFACGDVAMPPTGGEKQAFQAEMQAKIAANNVLAELFPSNYDQLRYPQDLSGSTAMPIIFSLSLGRYDGVVAFNDWCIPGLLCPIVKWVLECTKVLQMQRRLFGILIWKIGDSAVLFLSKTLIKPRSALKP